VLRGALRPVELTPSIERRATHLSRSTARRSQSFFALAAALTGRGLPSWYCHEQANVRLLRSPADYIVRDARLLQGIEYREFREIKYEVATCACKSGA
jgi:hypothetical protein